MKHAQLIIFLGVLSLYPGLYVAARASHLLVHSVSLVPRGGREVPSSHRVEAGDAKLASPNGLIAALFAPLRWLEVAAWYVAQPPPG